MDYLECEQFEKVLSFIENFPLTENPPDKNFVGLLNRFQIKSRVANSRRHKYGLGYLYNNGFTEKQMETIKGVLLSAKYNFNEIEDRLNKERPRLEADVMYDSYKQNDLKKLEKLRIEAAHKIRDVNDLVYKLNFDMESSKIINTGIKKIAENKLVKEAAVKHLLLKTTKNMIEDGVSLTEITNCLKTDLPAVYRLAKSMNCPFKLSPEEEKLLNKTSKKEPSQSENTTVTHPAKSETAPVFTDYAYI